MVSVAFVVDFPVLVVNLDRFVVPEAFVFDIVALAVV